MAPHLYTVLEAAETLRISRTKMYELLTTHKIESIRIGRSRRIPAEAVEDYVQGLRA